METANMLSNQTLNKINQNNVLHLHIIKNTIFKYNVSVRML